MGEAQPVSVELEDPSGKRFGQAASKRRPSAASDEEARWVGERGDDLRDLERRRAEAVETLVQELVEVGGDR